MASKIFPLTPNYTLITSNTVLDKTTGAILKLSGSVQSEIIQYINKSNISIQNMSNKAEVVVSTDSQTIDFYLKTSDGRIESKDGFLIEVFESGSDGKLTRLYKEEMRDPIDENNILEDGFSNYFDLEVD